MDNPDAAAEAAAAAADSVMTDAEEVIVAKSELIEDDEDENQNLAQPDQPDEADQRSVFVGNVDYATTPAELQEHFRNCGPINRITIMVDKFTGHPKGYAYVEFGEEFAVSNAITLDGSLFRERHLRVCAKRKNVPGHGRGHAIRGRSGMSLRGRGFRAFRGRGRARGAVATPY